MYTTIALEGEDGRREEEGYAGRGRVMHIDVDVHEFFILSYDFESRSLARKSITHLVALLMLRNRRSVMYPTLCKIKDEIFCLTRLVYFSV